MEKPSFTLPAERPFSWGPLTLIPTIILFAHLGFDFQIPGPTFPLLEQEIPYLIPLSALLVALTLAFLDQKRHRKDTPRFIIVTLLILIAQFAIMLLPLARQNGRWY